MPNCGIDFTCNERRGRECTIPTSRGSQAIQRLRNQSFQVSGPRLFNCLPKNIRNIKKVSVDEFKEKLDNYLSCLPDQPKIGNLVPSICDQMTARPSNSLPDVVKHKNRIFGGG